MNRPLIMSIALVSLIAMGSPAMADRGDCKRGNCAAGTNAESADPNCRGVRASLFVLDCGGFGTGDKRTNMTDDELTFLISLFFSRGAANPDCTDLNMFPFPPE